SNLITGRPNDVDAADIFLFQRTPKRVRALILDQLSKLLDLFICGVLLNPKIKLDRSPANGPPGPHSYSGVRLGRSLLLSNSDCRRSHEREDGKYACAFLPHLTFSPSRENPHHNPAFPELDERVARKMQRILPRVGQGIIR